MVTFQKALLRVPTTPGMDAEARLRDLLQLSRGWLGPVQLEHLTTHSEKVSRLAVSLGRGQGLGAEALARLRLAGLCHDLGKYLVPDEILAKPAALSTEERQLLDRHAEDGAVMSKALGVDDETAAYIRYHHARFHPWPLAEPELEVGIPFGARVLAVADAVVAMTSPRSYHSSRSPIAALSELRRTCGTQFDPDVVDAMTGVKVDSLAMKR